MAIDEASDGEATWPTRRASAASSRIGTSEQAPTTIRAVVTLPPAPTSSTAATLAIEITRYARDPSLRNVDRAPADGSAHWPTFAYFASVAAFCGRHHASLSRYQAMVALRPAAKSEYSGVQPSSVRSLVLSMA